MHRCGPGLLLALTITFVILLTGCLGKSSSNPGSGGVSTIILSPSGSFSMDVGSTQFFGATAKNATGQPILGVDIQFIVQSASPNLAAPLSIATNGNGCAGTWDASVSVCNQGTPGIATVTAITNGVTSPPTTVYVHQHIDSIQIRDPQNQLPYPYDCFSKGKPWQYEAVAFNGALDISNTVGPMTWSSSNTGVVTTTPILSGSPGNQVNLVQTTAAAPGVTRLFATAAGTTSTPLPYTTCLIKAIYLQIEGQSQGGNSITVNNGGAVSIKALAIDTLYGIADFAPLSAPPLTWSTSNPEVAAFSSTTNTTGTNSATARSNLGGATLTASCTPPSCNIGLPGSTPSGATVPSLPIYSSDCNATDVAPACPLMPLGTKGYASVSVDVTTTSTQPIYTAWAATTGCQDAPGCASALFSVTPGTTPIGPILTLPRTPNSITFNHLSSSRLYIGSNEGLMYVDVSASNPSVAEVFSSPTPCNVALCGKVLTISNDGNLAVISDTVSPTHHVYIYNGGSTTTSPIDLKIPGETATAAAFSPDQLKLFILTNTGTMYIYSTVDALTSVPVAISVTDVKFSANGSFAYVAGTPGPTSISGFATCDSPTTNVTGGQLTTTTYPTLPPLPTSPPFALFPIPTQQLDSAGNWAQLMLVLDPPNIDTFGVTVTQPALKDDQFVCNPPSVALDTNIKQTSAYLGQSNTPLYAQLATDGTAFVVVEENVPAVLVFNVSDGTTTSVPLAKGAVPLAASASPDGSRVYVAACDQYDQSTPPACAVGSVHIVNAIGEGTLPVGDVQQVPYVNAADNNDRNMCNNGGNPAPQCLPNLIAIKPQ